MIAEGKEHIGKPASEANVAAKVQIMFTTAQGLVNVDANLAMSYINQIIALSKENKYEVGIGKADLLLSAYHWFHGNIEKSLEVNQKAQSCFEKHEDYLHLSIAVRLLGMIYGELGDFDRCLELYYEALAIQEELGEKRQLAITYNNIASAQMRMGAREQGLCSYQKALDILDEIDSNEPQILTSKAMICTNMGQAYAASQDHDKGLHYHKLALRWSEMLDKNSRLVAQTYYHIGFHYVEIRDFANALPNLFNALEIAERMQNKRLMSDLYLLLAKSYCQTDNFERALSFAIKQRDLVKATDSESVSADVLNSHKMFADIYERMKDYGQAVYHYKFVMELNEKIQQQDKVVQVRNKSLRHQLERQKSELQQSNADLQMFASIASHDMRAPLRTIASFMQLLERKNEGKFDETDKQYLSFAVNGARHLERMIEDLLAYSKLDKNVGSPSVIDLSKIATQVDYNLKAYITERKAIFQVGKLPQVMAHQSLMVQLIQNIVNNGLKYNRSEVPSVSISDVSDNNETIIAIADNGIGIPEQQRQKAFKMFSRLHSASEFEGTGIGLAMCKKIMDFYRGRVWIEDGINGGSIFYLAFPNSKHPGEAAV
ncbi:MAG: tetratricopeptide repeat protein [Chitinophagales bacterium]|nr:tetratricopeptide repeat protein [Chitinophagales bacterium]